MAKPTSTPIYDDQGRELIVKAMNGHVNDYEL